VCASAPFLVGVKKSIKKKRKNFSQISPLCEPKKSVKSLTKEANTLATLTYLFIP